MYKFESIIQNHWNQKLTVWIQLNIFFTLTKLYLYKYFRSSLTIILSSFLYIIYNYVPLTGYISVSFDRVYFRIIMCFGWHINNYLFVIYVYRNYMFHFSVSLQKSVSDITFCHKCIVIDWNIIYLQINIVVFVFLCVTTLK